MSDIISEAQKASKPIYRTDKAEIVEYYREKYSEKTWRTKLADDLADYSSVKRSSLLRRFQGGRENKAAGKGQASEFKALGESGKVPPLGYEAPSGGYDITFVGEIRISGNCFPRHFECHLDGGEAIEFASALSEGDVDTMYDLMFFDYFEEDLAEGFCNSPRVTVKAA